MTLTLHYHPLASFCWKALVALYETDLAFERVVVDFGNPASAAAFKALWPMAKMPVLVDHARDATVAESTIVVEYLDAFYAGPNGLIPSHSDRAWRVRMLDRVFDSYLHEPMQKIVLDNLRPGEARDPYGVEQARAAIRQAYDYLETVIPADGWLDEDFSLADCSAAPALFYANTVEPLGMEHARTKAYLRQLMARASFTRVLDEAEPFFGFVPVDRKPARTPPA
jgi:glutathione S-transferase